MGNEQMREEKPAARERPYVLGDHFRDSGDGQAENVFVRGFRIRQIALNRLIEIGLDNKSDGEQEGSLGRGGVDGRGDGTGGSR